MAEDVRNALSTEGMEEFEHVFDAPDCVVLDSAYCSMGRMIAVRACKAAGFAYHDAVTLLELVPECGVTSDDVDAFERALADSKADVAELRASVEFKRISEAFHLAAKRALAAGPCLIHDRVTREFVRGLGYSCVSAMTYATDAPAMRVRARVSPLYADLTDPVDLDRAIVREDKVRRGWHALHSDTTCWGEPATYDLMLNTDQLGRDFAAEMLAHLMRGHA